MNTITLYRAVGPAELAGIRERQNRAFPPRPPDQPFFYPVCSLEYAEQMARDRDAQAEGVGFVTQFDVEQAFLADYTVQRANASQHREYWIPAECIDALNAAIVGSIRVIRRYVAAPSAEQPSVAQPSVQAPSAEQPSAEQPSVQAPSAEQPSVEQPIARYA